MFDQIKRMAADFRRQTMALIVCCFLLPLIMLLITVGVAEWINTIYGNPVGWFATAGALTLGLAVFSLVMLMPDAEFQSASPHPVETADEMVGPTPVAADMPSHANSNELEDNLAMADMIRQQIEHEIQDSPLAGLAVSAAVGTLIGMYPDTVKSVLDDYMEHLSTGSQSG